MFSLGRTLPATKAFDADHDFVGFADLTGSDAGLRDVGIQTSARSVKLKGGTHSLQLSRRHGELWLLVDDKPVAFAADGNYPAGVVKIGIYGGDVTVSSLKYKAIPER